MSDPRPFPWIDKKKMASLRLLCDRLDIQTQELTNSSLSGFRGDSTAMEKQIFERIVTLERQVGSLIETMQAAIQIVDESRLSQRVIRKLQTAWQRCKRIVSAIANNIVFQIFAVVGTAVGTLAAVWSYGGVLLKIILRCFHR